MTRRRISLPRRLLLVVCGERTPCSTTMSPRSMPSGGFTTTVLSVGHCVGCRGSPATCGRRTSPGSSSRRARHRIDSKQQPRHQPRVQLSESSYRDSLHSSSLHCSTKVKNRVCCGFPGSESSHSCRWSRVFRLRVRVAACRAFDSTSELDSTL